MNKIAKQKPVQAGDYGQHVASSLASSERISTANIALTDGQKTLSLWSRN